MLRKFANFLKELKERRIDKNLFYYFIGAIGFLEGITGIILFYEIESYMAGKLGWAALLICITGIPIILITTWFHGKKGEDPITKKEVFSITFFLLIGGFFITQKMLEPHPITIMIRMMDPNEKWFKKCIIEKFEKENNCKVMVKHFGADYEVVKTLQNESEKKRAENVSLVKVSMPLTRVLYTEGLVRQIDDLMSDNDLKRIKDEYNPLALTMCFYREITDPKMKLYYLPRKLETRVMIFRKSKVADAVKNWHKLESYINGVLKEENGYGLPLNFNLDSDVNMWDYYDILVAGLYWATTEYTGKIAAKLAHRSRNYEGTILGLIDRASQLGAKEEEIQDMYLFSDGLIDLFHWEAIFRKYNLYSEGMWNDDGWSGANIYTGFENDNVYLAWMHQLDCALIHGVEEFFEQGYLDDKEDLGISIMPLGVSFELTKDGIPKRIGTRRAHIYGWFWGIPKKASEPKLAYKLAEFITNRINHYKECEKFLLIPIRLDVNKLLKEALQSDWEKNIYQVSNKQLILDEEKLVPRFKTLTEYQDFLCKYYRVFEEIVIKKRYSQEGSDGRVDHDFIRERLKYSKDRTS